MLGTFGRSCTATVRHDVINRVCVYVADAMCRLPCRRPVWTMTARPVTMPRRRQQVCTCICAVHMVCRYAPTCLHACLPASLLCSVGLAGCAGSCQLQVPRCLQQTLSAMKGHAIMNAVHTVLGQTASLPALSDPVDLCCAMLCCGILQPCLLSRCLSCPCLERWSS